MGLRQSFAMVLMLGLGASSALAQAQAQAPVPVPTQAPSIPPALSRPVTAFWTAWKNRDLGSMYGLYCRDYQAKVPREEYMKLQRLLRYPLVEFTLTGAEVLDGRATVRIRARNDVPAHPLGSIDAETTQVWLQQADGTWCKEDEPLLLPFPIGAAH